MKLKSLILGSVAAAGLSTGAYAADLGVLTSLDVCDALGLSGLTISSDTNCLQITGGVDYKFVWGDYVNDSDDGDDLGDTGFGVVDTPDGLFEIPEPGFDIDDDEDANLDWQSYVEAWIKFVATAESDFGPAKAVIKLLQIRDRQVQNEQILEDDDTDEEALNFSEAYVSIGDTTVIMAGKKGSIANLGDDEPFNWLGLFLSEEIDAGVAYDLGYRVNGANDLEDFDRGGHVIQVVTDLGNGVSVKAGLENIDDSKVQWAGTLVGVLEYAGEGLSAHATVLAGGILDGEVDAYAVHAGFTGSFEQFRVRGAFAANNDLNNDQTSWNALGSAEATFDMFKLAASVEAAHDDNLDEDSWGFGASASAMVTDGVTINIGGRWFDSDVDVDDTEGYQIAASLSAAVTETLTLTGEVGVYGRNSDDESVYYGAAEVAWAPGGGFTSSLKGEAFSNGAYRATFKASKSFE